MLKPPISGLPEICLDLVNHSNREVDCIYETIIMYTLTQVWLVSLLSILTWLKKMISVYLGMLFYLFGHENLYTEPFLLTIDYNWLEGSYFWTYSPKDTHKTSKFINQIFTFLTSFKVTTSLLFWGCKSGKNITFNLERRVLLITFYRQAKMSRPLNLRGQEPLSFVEWKVKLRESYEILCQPSGIENL